MIIFFPLCINQIFLLRRNFPWPKPKTCPKCQGPRLWGHGFVWAYFDGLPQGVWLKLYRCPDCGAVHRLKPEGYFRRFTAASQQIRHCLAGRLRTGRWPSGPPSRPRQRNWLKNLRHKVLAFLGQNFATRLLEGFDCLVSLGIIPVSRII